MRPLAALALVALLATPLLPAASAQPAPAEEVLEGRLSHDAGGPWLVRADGARVRLPFDHRNEARSALGPLTGQVVRVGARVTRAGGVATARVTRLLDPTPGTLRARVEATADGGLALVDGPRRLRVVSDRWTTPLVRSLVGTVVDVDALVFARGEVLVRAVKARARMWHFQPIVVAPILLLPRWRRPGTEYWVTSLGESGEVYVGLRHLDVAKLDFASPEPAARAGLADRVPGVSR